MRSACVKLCGIPAPRLLDTLQVYAELIRGAVQVVGHTLVSIAALVQAVILVLSSSR